MKDANQIAYVITAILKKHSIKQTNSFLQEVDASVKMSEMKLKRFSFSSKDMLSSKFTAIWDGVALSRWVTNLVQSFFLREAYFDTILLLFVK